MSKTHKIEIYLSLLFRVADIYGPRKIPKMEIISLENFVFHEK